MVYHGTSDPIFSSDDSVACYEGLRATNGGDASNFARLFLDSRDEPLQRRPGDRPVRHADAARQLGREGPGAGQRVASARGAGNPAGANADVPRRWAANRTRPLCPYPKVARYNGSGSSTLATSFTCQ